MSGSSKETLKSREGVRVQYSHLTTAMMRAVDIDAKHITDTLPNRGLHVWNEIKVDDRTYALDATRGSGYVKITNS